MDNLFKIKWEMPGFNNLDNYYSVDPRVGLNGVETARTDSIYHMNC